MCTDPGDDPAPSLDSAAGRMTARQSLRDRAPCGEENICFQHLQFPLYSIYIQIITVFINQKYYWS